MNSLVISYKLDFFSQQNKLEKIVYCFQDMFKKIILSYRSIMALLFGIQRQMSEKCSQCLGISDSVHYLCPPGEADEAAGGGGQQEGCHLGG